MAGSFLDDLRAIRDEVERNDSLTIAVPPSNQIVVRFRSPEDRDKLTPYVAAYRTGGALTAEQEMQLIVDCCDEILKVNPGGGFRSYDGGPLRFDAGDERWGDDVANAHDCVRKLYNLDEVPLAAAGAADTLMGWLQGIRETAQRRVEGESEGSETS